MSVIHAPPAVGSVLWAAVRAKELPFLALGAFSRVFCLFEGRLGCPPIQGKYSKCLKEDIQRRS